LSLKYDKNILFLVAPYPIQLGLFLGVWVQNFTLLPPKCTKLS